MRYVRCGVGENMKIEEYVWSLLIFFLIFLLHYGLGRLDKAEVDLEVNLPKDKSTEIFQNVKLKKNTFL